MLAAFQYIFVVATTMTNMSFLQDTNLVGYVDGYNRFRLIVFVSKLLWNFVASALVIMSE